jgi:DNA-binding winged helix-turn-helix (wHTH) protein
MEHFLKHGQRFILNHRWQFDSGDDQLIDTEFRRDPVRLTPAVSRLLAMLAHSPYIVLSKRRLLDDGWRSLGFEIADNGLSQAIATLRQIFEMLPPGRPYIKTIPRIGYCLLADVHVSTAGRANLNIPRPETNQATAESLLECTA